MPPKLIRNIDKQFCDEFLCHGKLRLKPVARYKDIADPDRADKTEGARGIEARPQTSISGSTDSLWMPPGISIQGTTQGAQPSIFFGAGSTVSIIEVIPQAYVLCMSEERIAKFGDAAFVVNDPVQFGERLFKVLNASRKKILRWRLGKVRYGGNKDVVTDQPGFEDASASLMQTEYSEGYFTKPTDYATEREWRYIFLAEDQEAPLADVEICDKSLIECCQPLADI